MLVLDFLGIFLSGTCFRRGQEAVSLIKKVQRGMIMYGQQLSSPMILARVAR